MLKPAQQQLERELQSLEQRTKRLNQQFDGFRKSAFARFPLAFVMLSTLGLVMTFYGFEKLIDSTPLFADRPLLLFITGVLVLLGTGTLYKKLS